MVNRGPLLIHFQLVARRDAKNGRDISQPAPDDAMKLSIERLLLLSLSLGLCLLGFSTLVSPFWRSTTGHGSIGFPIAYGSQIDCYLSGPGGCGYSYDPTLMALGYLFWVTVTFATAYLTQVRFFSKNTTPHGSPQLSE